MGLAVEEFTVKGGRKLPVADYVRDYDEDGEFDPPLHSGCYRWAAWLQGRRVELNAMTSPQFLEWLDRKVAEHDRGKVVPPEGVLRARLREQTEAALRERLAGQILRDAGLDELVSRALGERQTRLETLDVGGRVREGLDADPRQQWLSPLERLAQEVAGE